MNHTSCHFSDKHTVGGIVFYKHAFLVSIVSLRELLTPRGGAISDPRGMLGRIYVNLHITMLHTKYRSFGCCGFREEDFSCIFHCKPMGDNDAPQGGACMETRGTVSRIYKEDHYTLLHPKHESSGPCGFGEDFFMFFP